MTRNSRFLKAALVFLFGFLWILSGYTDTQFVLENEIWSLSIDPNTLGITAQPRGEPAFRLSEPQKHLGAAAGVHVYNNTAEWTYPAQQVSLSVALHQADFSIIIHAAATGEFTFPVLAQDDQLRGLILPRWEGCYAPMNDPIWKDYLIDYGEWNTTDGLCMPFWGLDRGTHTVTYLATNPYNNELKFSQTDGKLTGKFTHEFPSINPQKEYGFLIALGSSSPVQPAKRYRQWLVEQGKFVSWKEKTAAVPLSERLLGAMHIYLWGDGVTPEMIKRIQTAGLDRMRFCVDDLRRYQQLPETFIAADRLGYLFGPYDSYDSIHDPASVGTDNTWDTAQFNLNLFQTGPIVGKNGKKKPGFNKIGYLLSPKAARSYVEKRVRENMQKVPFNYYFIDCDAFGEVFDDYSPNHITTQAEDAAERNSRMAWIRDTFQVVIGSEGGSAYAAPIVHVVEGMIAPVIGWGDPDMKNQKSPYYIGRYYPPEQPEIFFKTVPLKDKFIRLYYDPRFRLPLYEIVFHDSVVATHHWNSGNLKFQNGIQDSSQIDLLYQVPPLYHLNLKEFEKRKLQMKSYYEIFSPWHRKLGFSQMADFKWLTEDRRVQQTIFENRVEIISNFRETDYQDAQGIIPKRSLRITDKDAGVSRIYTP